MNSPYEPRPETYEEPIKRRTGPTKAETSAMPDFEGISMDQIEVPQSREACEQALAEIADAGRCGFDTESKPTFRVGEKSSGPHVVQFALAEKAYIFQLHREHCERVAAEIIGSEEILKIGFGLKNDHSQIRDRFGIKLKQVLDLDQVFREQGFRGQLGVRGAIGFLFQQNFGKSKRTTTSNWAKRELTPKQLIYAANDAFAALKVLDKLENEGLYTCRSR